MKRKLGVLFLVSLVVVSLFASDILAAEEKYPNKPITIYGSNIGGNTDLVIRCLWPVAEKYLGQPLLLTHKIGGGGRVALDYVSRLKPDGYVFNICTVGETSIKPAIEGSGYGPGTMVPVCMLTAAPIHIFTRLDRPWKDLKGLIEWAKAHPGELKVGSPSYLSPGHVPWEMFMKETGITARIAQYDGGGEMSIAIMGNHVDVAPGVFSHTGPSVLAGKLGCLATLDDKRFHMLPDVPTAKELGINVSFTNWNGIFAPKGTPRPAVDFLAQAFKKMTEDPEAIKLLGKIGLTFEYLGPDALMDHWKKEYENLKVLGEFLKTK